MDTSKTQKNQLISITEAPANNLLLLTYENFENGCQIINLNDLTSTKWVTLDSICENLPSNSSINSIELLQTVKSLDNLIYFGIKLDCKVENSKVSYLAICSINSITSEFKTIYLLESCGSGDGNSGEVLNIEFNSIGEVNTNYEDEFTIISSNQFKLIWPINELNGSNKDTNSNNVAENGIFGNIKWYQTSEDLTISINLPSQIQKDQLNCWLKSETLELEYNSDSMKNSWFGPIIASESYWTLENSQYLTIYLQKLNEKTKWPHLFLVDDGNLETLDPSELREISEKLEKYTGDEVRPYQANTLHDQFEEEEDELERDSITIGVKFGGKPGFVSEFSRDHSWLGLPLPLVNSDNQSIVQSLSVALKYDVHGLIYDSKLKHKATLPALGYIQSSKNQKKFTYYHPSTYNTIIVEYTQNLFIYLYPSNDDNGIQRVVKLNDSEEILGISGFSNSNNLLVLTAQKLYKVELD